METAENRDIDSIDPGEFDVSLKVLLELSRIFAPPSRLNSVFIQAKSAVAMASRLSHLKSEYNMLKASLGDLTTQIADKRSEIEGELAEKTASTQSQIRSLTKDHETELKALQEKHDQAKDVLNARLIDMADANHNLDVDYKGKLDAKNIELAAIELDIVVAKKHAVDKLRQYAE